MSTREVKSNLSLIMSGLLILTCISFWYWLISHHFFLIGKVSEIFEANENYSILIIENWFKNTPVAASQVELESFELGDWLLIYGLDYNEKAGWLLAETIHSNPILTVIFGSLPSKWLPTLAQYSYPSIAIAGIFILFSEKVLKLTYTILITSFLVLTLWHAGIFAIQVGYLNTTNYQLYSLLIIATIFSIINYGSTKNNDASPRLIAVILAFLYGVTILKWFGADSGFALALFFACALAFPMITSVSIAAYLLSNALGGSVIGSYIILIFSFVLSLSLLDKNTRTQYSTVIAKILHIPSPPLGLNGKVTLAELLKQHRK